MKLKKILLNILENKDFLKDINEEISNAEISDDILGFHIVVTNQTNLKVNCEFIMKSSDVLNWSNDMKKSVNDCITIEYNVHKCTIKILPNVKTDILIWNNEKNSFLLKSVKNCFDEEKTGELRSILLDNTVDKNFEELFGFKKKYHFDQYRFLLVLNLCDNITLENEKFIKELVDKIINDSKKERKIQNNEEEFFNLVFTNLLDGNAGILDSFKNYRTQIINKLKLKVKNIGNIVNNGATTISYNRNNFNNLTMFKQIEINNNKIVKEEKDDKLIINNNFKETNPFDRKRVIRKINNKSINNELFIVNEYEKEGTIFIPNDTIILYKYNNVNISEIEKTIENLIIASQGETYEIIMYLDKFVIQMEKVIENLFHNFDSAFKIKIVFPHNKIGKIGVGYSEIQKLIVMSNFVNSGSNYYYILSINSFMPSRYLHFIKGKYKEERDTIVMIKRSNCINMQNGRIDIYEANTNKLFSYFVECLFPVLPKYLLKKINFKSSIFGNMNKFKEFKNFLVKNGTIYDVEIFDYFQKNSLHVFEGSN